MKAALEVTGLWFAVIMAGVLVLGNLPDWTGGVWGIDVVFLALYLLLLTLVTKRGVMAIATPMVPSQLRWAVLFGGVGLGAVGFLALRFGAPGRVVWEAFGACGQLLVVVVAAGYLPRFLKHPGELLPLVSVMICADAVSFIAGPTHVIAKDVADYYLAGRQGVYPLSDMLLMKFPAPGSFELYPLFGLADWFMVVFLSTAARRFSLDDGVKGIPLAVLGLFLASAAARLFHLFLPALPILALFFILGMGCRHGRALWPGKQERLLTLLPPLVSAGLLFLLR